MKLESISPKVKYPKNLDKKIKNCSETLKPIKDILNFHNQQQKKMRNMCVFKAYLTFSLKFSQNSDQF